MVEMGFGVTFQSDSHWWGSLEGSESVAVLVLIAGAAVHGSWC